MQESLNKQAEIDINNLVRETSHVITALDLPMLFELNNLANIISKKDEQHNIDIMLAPIRCGNRWLCSPHIDALIWHDKHATALSEVNEIYVMLMRALICDRDFEKYTDALRCEDASEIIKILDQYAKLLQVNIIELALCIARLLPAGEESNDEGVPLNNMLGWLVREYGQTVSYWLHEAPLDEIKILIAEYESRITSEYQQALKMARGSKITMPPMKTKWNKAIVGYRHMLKQLRDAWAVKNG